MSEIADVVVSLAFAIAVMLIALAFNNQCEPFLALMVGGCR
jgi:divalent metal cation (Fe/Co/Zn/Cd) transporter